ncbi:hypothetical protein MTO96_005659 [Rhipicephalus appendiculatus]
MAATAIRGYDPTTLAGKEVSTSKPEDYVPPTDIVDGGLFTVVALRKRRQQSKATKGSATDKATSAKIPPEKKDIPSAGWASWRPRFGKDVSRELPTRPPMNPVAGGTNQQAPPPPKTSQTSRQTSSKTSGQGASVLQAGELPPLTDAGALRRPSKMTASQAQNAQLLANIAPLEAGSAPVTPA